MDRLGRLVNLTASLLLLMVLSCFVACMPTDKDMAEEVERMNQRMPQVLGDGMTLKKIEFNKKGFIFIITCDDDFVDMKLLEENKGEVKKMMIDNLRSKVKEDNQTRGLVDYCKNKNKTLAYNFVGLSSGQEVKCEITSDEM